MFHHAVADAHQQRADANQARPRGRDLMPCRELLQTADWRDVFDATPLPADASLARQDGRLWEDDEAQTLRDNAEGHLVTWAEDIRVTRSTLREIRTRLGCERYHCHSPHVLRVHLHVNGQQITLHLPSTLAVHPLLDAVASAFHTSVHAFTLQHGISNIRRDGTLSDQQVADNANLRLVWTTRGGGKYFPALSGQGISHKTIQPPTRMTLFTPVYSCLAACELLSHQRTQETPFSRSLPRSSCGHWSTHEHTRTFRLRCPLPMSKGVSDLIPPCPLQSLSQRCGPAHYQCPKKRNDD